MRALWLVFVCSIAGFAAPVTCGGGAITVANPMSYYLTFTLTSPLDYPTILNTRIASTTNKEWKVIRMESGPFTSCAFGTLAVQPDPVQLAHPITFNGGGMGFGIKTGDPLTVKLLIEASDDKFAPVSTNPGPPIITNEPNAAHWQIRNAANERKFPLMGDITITVVKTPEPATFPVALLTLLLLAARFRPGS
jgi:hypothetical protein